MGKIRSGVGGYMRAAMAIVALVFPGSTTAMAEDGSDFWARWNAMIAKGRDEQPSWATPLVTNTARVEQRFRFDSAFQHVGNGSDIHVIDGGKGLDLMLTESTEVQLALPPYIDRETTTGKGNVTGFNDWQFLRLKQRLASANARNGDYIVSFLVGFQAPTGVQALSSGAYQISPTLAAGKGFGPIVIQSAIGLAIPLTRQNVLGTQILGNTAFQVHIARYFWPEFEVNWTHYSGGQRDGKNQVFLLPGIVFSRFAIGQGMSMTFGVGYQFAVAPRYRPSPLLPSYSHAWLLSTRLNF